MRQFAPAGGWIKGREKLVFGAPPRLCHLVEQRRLPRVGITDHRNDRVWHSSPALAMQTAHAFDPLKIIFDPDYTTLKEPPVSLDWVSARPAEEPKSTALTFEMGPGANEPRLLIGEMS